MAVFEIYASDLTEQAQKVLCEKAGIKSVEEMNWDVFPITTIEFDDEENDLTEEEKEQAEEVFVSIAEQYEDCDDMIDALRSLESCGELTQAQYDYLTEEWDNLLIKHNL